MEPAAHHGGRQAAHQGGRLSVAPPYCAMWIDWIGQIVGGFQTSNNSSFYFKTILSKLAHLLTSLLSQGEVLRTKVKKICEGFHAAVYPCPEVNFLPLP